MDMRDGTEKRKAAEEDKSVSEAKRKSMMFSAWCADCWARSRSACKDGGHRLMDSDAALAEAAVPVLSLRLKILKILKKLPKRKRRLDAVLELIEAETVKLDLEVDGFRDDTGWSDCGVSGGTVRVALACRDVSDAEVEGLCKALKDVELEYERHACEWWCRSAQEEAPLFPRAQGQLELDPTLHAKLPKYDEDFLLSRSPVLVSSKMYGGAFVDLVIHVPKLQSGEGEGMKVLGTVVDDLDVDDIESLKYDFHCSETRLCERGCRCLEEVSTPTVKITDVNIVKEDKDANNDIEDILDNGE